MLYKIGPPPSFSSLRDDEISREVTLSRTLEDVAEPAEDPDAFSMPTLASILPTAVESGAVAGTGSGSEAGSCCSSNSLGPVAGDCAHAARQPVPEVCSPRREGRGLDLSVLSLSEGAWVRQMNWAVMQPYWQHQDTGETEWDEVPEALSLQARQLALTPSFDPDRTVARTLALALARVLALVLALALAPAPALAPASSLAPAPAQPPALDLILNPNPAGARPLVPKPENGGSDGPR